MFNSLLALLNLGMIAFGLLQWSRHRRVSHLVLAILGAALLTALVTRHPLVYAAAGALLILRGYVAFREKSAGVAQDTVSPPADSSTPSGRAAIEREIAELRSGDGAFHHQFKAAVRLRRLGLEELRPAFEGVRDRNRAVRETAAALIRFNGDDRAIDILRKAVLKGSDAGFLFPTALCARGSDDLDEEKELYLTHEDARIRGSALTGLGEAIGEGTAKSPRNQDRLRRFVRAVVAETDRSLFMQSAKRLIDQGCVTSLAARFGDLSVAHRLALVTDFPLTNVECQKAAIGELFARAAGDSDAAVAEAARRALRSERFADAGLLPPGETVERPVPVREGPDALEGWVELTFETPAASVPCHGGGELEVAAGALRARIQLRHQRGGEVDPVRVRLVMADAQGQEWGLESYLVGWLFTDQFEEDEPRAALEKNAAFKSFSEAPKEWHEAIEKRCLMSGVATLLDSRFYIQLKIGQKTHELRMKYQGPEVDVGILGSELVVRVRRLREIITSPSEDGGPADRGSQELPPFAWLVSNTLLLCFSESGLHYATSGDVEEMVERDDREPSEAKRLPTQGTPQAGVVYRPE